MELSGQLKDPAALFASLILVQTEPRSGVHSYSAFVTPKFTLRAHNHLSQQPYVAGVKVKLSRYRPGVAQRMGRGIASSTLPRPRH